MHPEVEALDSHYSKDVLLPCAAKNIPRDPSHALRVIDNSQGEETPYYTFAFQFDGVFYHHETGHAVLQYVGDRIINQWPLTVGEHDGI
ncbi:hypothetical protein [Duganella vulcania]|uniref:Uncharacterized protein n=1 Tax=Duganella vulcania TaxID=2692166 RepID=A0A845GCX1_9BURK|nr:hypothetical protein [Duganella vulcania]MYM92463.1 hypothetical protein [Duganella vulcania]